MLQYWHHQKPVANMIKSKESTYHKFKIHTWRKLCIYRHSGRLFIRIIQEWDLHAAFLLVLLSYSFIIPPGMDLNFYFRWQFFPHPSALTSNVICSPTTPTFLLFWSYRGHITACPLQKGNDVMMVSGSSRAYSLSVQQALTRHHGPISHYKLTYPQCHFNLSKRIRIKSIWHLFISCWHLHPL